MINKTQSIFIVSKIKKIKIKDEESPKYLVKWYKSSDETWESICSFPDKIETYPGYKESLNHLFRVRNKSEKDAVNIMINYFQN